jgi:hypothetical protein
MSTVFRTSILRFSNAFSFVGFCQRFVWLNRVLKSWTDTSPWVSNKVIALQCVKLNLLESISLVATLWYAILKFMAVCSYTYLRDSVYCQLYCWALLWHVLAVTEEAPNIIFIPDWSKNHLHWVTSDLVCPETRGIFVWFILQGCRSLRLYYVWVCMISEWLIWKESEGTRVA